MEWRSARAREREKTEIDLYIVPEQRKRRMVRQPNIAHPHADTNYVMISPRASATYTVARGA